MEKILRRRRATEPLRIFRFWQRGGISVAASKIESYQKMKRYRENQEAAAKAAGGAALRSFGVPPVKDDSLYKEE